MSGNYRRIVLAARPSGMPKDSDFRIEEVPIPEPAEGEVVVRNIFMSIDPYMRGRMREGPSYAPAVQLGELMVGGTAGQVTASRNGRFPEGVYVNGMLGWQEYGVSDGTGLRQLDPAAAPISTSLGILGMPGMTAYFGLLDLGAPQEGETVAVTGAGGAVGALVGQIAKIKGCRAVGLAGTDAKCTYAVDEVGFDACVNYKNAGDLQQAVADACPKGVDVYFDNVGGPVADAVILNLNEFSRVPVCGQIALYNAEEPAMGPRLFFIFLTRRVKVQGFIVSDFAARWGEGLAQMTEWLQQGKLKYKEDIAQGIENAPQALIGVLQGANLGKQLVQLSDAP